MTAQSSDSSNTDEKQRFQLFDSAKEFIFLGQIAGNISITANKCPKFLTILHKLHCILQFLMTCFVAYYPMKYVAVKIVEQNFFQPPVVIIFSYVAYICGMIAFSYPSHRFQHSIDLYGGLISKIPMAAFQTPFPTRNCGVFATFVWVGITVLLVPGICIMVHVGVLNEISAQSILLNQFPGTKPLQWTCFVIQLLATSSFLFHCVFLLLLLQQCNLGMDEWVLRVEKQSQSEVANRIELYLEHHDQFRQVLESLNKYWGATYFWLMLFVGASKAASYYLILSAMPILHHAPVQSIVLMSTVFLSTLLIMLITYPGIEANKKLDYMVTLLFQKISGVPSSGGVLSFKTRDRGKEAMRRITAYMTYLPFVRNPIKIANTVDLTREAVLGYWATLVTYLIVMLQFQSTPESMGTKEVQTLNSTF